MNHPPHVLPGAPPRGRTFRTLAATFLDLVLPRGCCGCGATLPLGTPAVFCSPCYSNVRLLSGPLCATCGLPLTAASRATLCPRCIAAPPAFARARSWAYYSTTTEGENPVARALWALKYDRRLDIGLGLARVLADRPPFRAREHDLTIPVPLDRSRLRWRGFNQACVLAAAVARRLGVPLAPWALRRIRATPPQVSLPERARTANIRGAFAVPYPARISGGRLLLIDDVYTTGATVGESAAALRAAGAASVDVLTLARAVRS